MMNRPIITLIILAAVSAAFAFACSSAETKKAPEKKETVEQKKEDEAKGEAKKEEKKETEEKKASDGAEAVKGDAAKEDLAKKEAAEEKKEEKDPNFDGMKYVGPAKQQFASGLDQYFASGCDAAVKVWAEAFREDQKNGTIAFNIALCYERQKKEKESREWYEKAFNAHNKSIEALYNMVSFDLRKGTVDKDSYEKYAAEIKDAVQRNNFLAWFNYKLTNYDETIKYARMALKEDEQNVEAMVTLGSAYYNKDMLELAEMVFSTAEQINPNNFQLQRIYGFLEYKKGQKKKASDHFQKAKKLNPELPEVSNMLAVLAMEIEDFETAKNELEFALKIDGELLGSKMNLAVAYKGLKNYKKTKELLQELEQRKDLPKQLLKDVCYNLAILFLDADVEGDKNPTRFDTAVNYFNKYLEFVDKKDKNEQKRIAEYIKEGTVEKKKLEALLKMKARQEAKKKAAEEEQKAFEEFTKLFEETKKTDTVEAWEAFLKKYPELDAEDERGKYAIERLNQLKNGGSTAPQQNPEGEKPKEETPKDTTPAPAPAAEGDAAATEQKK